MSDFGQFISTMAIRRAEALRHIRELDNAKRWGRVLLASRLGLWDHAWIPSTVIRANGRPFDRFVDAAPGSRWHRCEDIPEYLEQADALSSLTERPDNRARRLEALGLEVARGNKAAKIIGREIRGVMRCLWLFHLWSGDDVRLLRENGRYYHPDDVSHYWGVAWAMHRDGTIHADACAWLHLLCSEYKRRTGKSHAGMVAFNQIQQFLEEAA